MRTRKAFLNGATALLSEVVSVICELILPRLILRAFGSSYNGITSSITQFMNCIILLRAGVGGVTRAALYRPLANNDTVQISRIVRATEMFMRRVALLFAVALLAFACVYPLLVQDSFDWLFTFTLVLIIGASTCAQTYFGITYQILIESDQRQYISVCISIFTTILNTIVAAILILAGCSIHIVKLGSAVVFTLNPIMLNLYVSRRYKIDKTVAPDNSAIAQRWDAFAQQAAAFVNNNTDIMVLTAFCDIKEVSVYTVYHLVTNELYKLETAITTGVTAAFGNILAKKEEKQLQKNVKVFEFLLFSSSTFLFVCGGNLIIPFVKVYTRGVLDVEYARPFFGFLMCVNQYLFCARLPYQMVTEAAGHFRQTRNGAVFEAVLNIVTSILLVYRFGLIGVTVGTFLALSFRTMQYAFYASNYILHRSIFVALKNILFSILDAVAVSGILSVLPGVRVHSYFTWFLYALEIAAVTLGVIAFVTFVFYRQEFLDFFKMTKRLAKRSNKRNKSV